MFICMRCNKLEELPTRYVASYIYIYIYYEISYIVIVPAIQTLH